MRLSARFEDDRVVEVRYKVRGCTASIAAGSALTELMSGRTRVELGGIDAAAIEGALDGLSTESKHVAVLCADSVRALAKARG